MLGSCSLVESMNLLLSKERRRAMLCWKKELLQDSTLLPPQLCLQLCRFSSKQRQQPRHRLKDEGAAEVCGGLLLLRKLLDQLVNLMRHSHLLQCLVSLLVASAAGSLFLKV